MYLERLNPNLMGSGNGMDTFDAMQQQGIQAMQDGMQAKNTVEGQRANAMQNAMAEYQQEQAAKQKQAGSLLNLGLSLATGGLGAGNAVADAAGNAITQGIKDSALGQMAGMLNPLMRRGVSQIPGVGGYLASFF